MRAIVLSVRPAAPGWVQIEYPEDLLAWQPLVNVLTTNTSGPYLDEPPPETRKRFYRAVAPGPSVGEALARWQRSRPEVFHYQFENFIVDNGGRLFQGTVVVSNGVTRIQNLFVNGTDASEYPPEAFPSIELIFTQLAEIEACGVKLAHVRYDPRWGFPATVMIVRAAMSPFVQYRIWDFGPGEPE